ncbi:MAG: anaerobic ribonucleoside-triphosphate reductase activating protein [Sulfurospirillaceae bacterium]|nr:anaerobic ribonucleoside-triphosphate reductase activating protein [Sulfurospirillaceae bacterium]
MSNVTVNNPIYSITPFTTLDYPEHLASIFWFAKCNMACPYCYNPRIVKEKGSISTHEALEFLSRRIGRLDSVVLSGGECTLYPLLEDFCAEIKALGFQIKIDTNGSNPQIIQRLVEQKLIDYIALDYKAPYSKYKTITSRNDFELFSQTLDYLIASNLAFEIRTTLHSDLLTINDINTIIDDLISRHYPYTYYLQNYLHVEETLGQTKMQQNILNTQLLNHTLPIELRNFR